MPQPRVKPVRKSASDLRSSSTSRPGDLPHKLHMRLVSLEMERYRRARERDHLLSRAAHCELRCAEIDAEVHGLMNQLNKVRPKQLVHSELKPLPAAARATRDVLDTARSQVTSMLHSY